MFSNWLELVRKQVQFEFCVAYNFVTAYKLPLKDQNCDYAHIRVLWLQLQKNYILL